MGFRIIYGNLLEQQVDAIVNTTDRFYSGGGGVDLLIHRAEGPGLDEKTDRLSRLHLGEAKYTTADTLPCKYIIHTSGPRWRRGSYLEKSLLGSCYRNSISLARHLGCRTIAFPLICSKSKHFPKAIAFTTAVDSILECLEEANDIEVILVIYAEKKAPVFQNILDEVQSFIDENYLPADDEEVFEMAPMDLAMCTPATVCKEEPRSLDLAEMDLGGSRETEDGFFLSSIIDDRFTRLVEHPTAKNLEDIPLYDDFAKTLTKLIEDSDIKNKSDIYLGIGMSKTGFWKIQSGKSNPTKMTVFAIAIMLKLNLDQTADLLMRAGYCINRSSLQDMVIAAMISMGIFDRNVVDQTLYDLDLQVLPGSVI